MSATIEVVSGREGTFRVKCTSYGGRTFTMDVEGPGYSGEEQDQMMVEAVGEPQRMGNDTYSATTSVISGGCNGDTYQCTASNGVAPNGTGNVILKGSSSRSALKSDNFVSATVASDPVITLLEQTSATSVRVEWSQPSGGATVTGYVVHYSDGDTDRTESVPASSTSSLITNLTKCNTYNFSVEATSEHLSGESDTLVVELGTNLVIVLVMQSTLCFTLHRNIRPSSQCQSCC